MVGGIGGGGSNPIPTSVPTGPTGNVETVTTPDGQPVVGDSGAPPSTPQAPAAQYDGTVQPRSQGNSRPQDPGAQDLGTTVFNSVHDVGGDLGNTDMAGLQNIASGVKAKVEGFQAQMDGLKLQIKTNTELRDKAVGERAALLNERGGLDMDSDEGKDRAAAIDKQVAGLDTVIKVASKNIDDASGKLEDLRGEIDKAVDQGRADCQKLLKEINAREDRSNANKKQEGGGTQKPSDQTATQKCKDTVLSALSTIETLSATRIGEIAAADPQLAATSRKGGPGQA